MRPLPGSLRRAPAALLTTLLLALAPAGVVVAADTPDAGGLIDYVEAGPDGVRLLVSTDGAAVDPDSVVVQVDGEPVEVTVEDAEEEPGVRRTAVLLIDSSNSMRGAKIAAAVDAVSAFLDAAPADLRVGVVSFADTVETLLEPVADPDRVREVVADLELSRDTRLIEGAEQALEVVGSAGQRQVLLLSDGKDTTGLPVGELLASLDADDVRVDVVALSGPSQQKQPATLLGKLARAGSGEVLEADPSSLAEAFAASGDALREQVSLAAPLPDPAAEEVSVEVSLVADGTTYEDRALTLVRQGPVADVEPESAGPASYEVVGAGWQVPRAVALGAVAAIGVGILLAFLSPVLASAGGPRRRRLSLEQRIAGQLAPESQESAAGRGGAASTASLATSAKQFAQRAVSADKDREARIAQRLDAAGSGLKPSEWVLVHAGVALVAAVLGFLVGGFSILVALLFGVLGAVAPPVYLRLRAGRRRAAFSALLADTLQLMAGSLQAGQSLAQSIDTVVREGQEPITSEFRRVLVASRLGIAIEDAMEEVAERMESEDFGWVVMAVRIQREVGGNLSELLVTVASTLREREFLRRHIKALSAEGRLSMYVLAGLPPVFLLYLTLTNYEYVSVMFTEQLGWLMMGGAVVLLAVGMLWMSKIVDVEL
ncbi:type II secretion system F family protein [Nocardioidaceae bacterium]|nr:type II secretion system F family protein [Nocardioidaceae bacterium]